MKVFTADYLNELTMQAQHRNIHEIYHDTCPRLFNAIEPGSYIRPQRHASQARDELLIAFRGSMALVTFDEQWVLTGIVRFSADRNCDDLAIGVEVLAIM